MARKLNKWTCQHTEQKQQLQNQKPETKKLWKPLTGANGLSNQNGSSFHQRKLSLTFSGSYNGRRGTVPKPGLSNPLSPLRNQNIQETQKTIKLSPQTKQISAVEKRGGQSLQSRSPRSESAPKSTHDEPTKLRLQSTTKPSNFSASSSSPSTACSLYEPLLQPAAEHLQLRSAQPFSKKSKPDGKSFPLKCQSQKKHKLPQKGSKQMVSMPPTTLKRKPSRRSIQRELNVINKQSS